MKETLNITEPELDTYLAKYTCVFESNMDGLTTQSKQNCANIVIPLHDNEAHIHQYR